MAIFFFLVSFGASVIGAICGIGGGVIIKPMLDMFHLGSVSTISFLSGCTVLAMSCYSVVRSMIAKDSLVELRTGTPLAIGAAIGGIIGKQLFIWVRTLFENQSMVGAIQAACLVLVTLGTLVYTLKKSSIKTHNVQSIFACALIGVVLGIISSFLGIGGGPINLVVLYFFFSMDTKTAAQNSLYIILFSQFTSFASTLITKNVPEFDTIALALMVVGGVLGGMAGRVCNKKMDNRAVDKLFILLMVVIIFISCYNTFYYAMQ